MGVTALVLGSFTSLGLIGWAASRNPNVDIIDISFEIINLVGALLAPWRRATAATLLTLRAISLILIGYFTTNVSMVAFRIIYQISATFAAASRS